jgi:hypothetical protein
MKPKVIDPEFNNDLNSGKILQRIIYPLSFLVCLFILVLKFQSCSGTREGEKVLGVITVRAGDHDRFDTPVRFDCKLTDILGDSSSLSVLYGNRLMLYEFDGGRSKLPVQWEPKTRFPWEQDENEGALVWILDGVTGKGSERKFRLVLKAGLSQEDTFSVQDIDKTSLLIKSGERPVLQYNYGIVREKEGQEGIYDKSSYIHPVWTPKGEIITGDFSPEHIWQRGIFLAWQKVKFGGMETNFWELGNATGRTLKDDIDPDIIKGQVFTGLVVHNKGTVEGRTFFREKCIIRLYNRPEHDNWMFDITFRQWPVDPENPDKLPDVPVVMELQKVYYGGMSFRGVSPGWLHYDFIARNREQLAKFDRETRWMDPADSLDILTSEGFGRKSGNATPARWIDYTGPLADGWGGLVMLDNPSNIRYPTPLRIHPDMPYFCFAFAKDDAYSITGKSPLQLTYRIIVHNGRPDRDYNERVARDFTRPPEVSWQRVE